MKKLTSLILVLLIVLSVSAYAAAAESVRGRIGELPTVEEFQAMNEEEQLEAYNRTQEAYDAYMALPEEERAGISGAEETFEALFGYFNTLVAPAAPETEEETSFGSMIPMIAVIALAAAAVTVALIRKRKA